MQPTKVLLVEDNPQDEQLTLRTLRRLVCDLDVDVARDGAEALDYLWRRGPFAGLSGQALPGLVLLDIRLPKLSGIDVLARMRTNETTCALPVVMLTSSDEQEDIRQSYAHGANSYVCKPIGAEEFSAAVSRLALYWLTLNRVPEV